MEEINAKTTVCMKELCPIVYWLRQLGFYKVKPTESTVKNCPAFCFDELDGLHECRLLK